MPENHATIADHAAPLPLFGGYALDRTRGCLLLGPEEVHLRPQAYRLLAYLAVRPGVLVEKDQLIQHIWQDRAVGDDSLVQCLRDVRQALGPDAAKHIRTVRGRGYIFDQPDAAPPIREAPAAVDDEAADGGNAGETLPRGEPAGRPTRWVPIAAAGLALVSLAGLLHFRGVPVGEVAVESIAVMPLVNATGDTDLDYVVDGTADVLINRLAESPNITVKARSTVFHYKGRDTSPQQLASELSVDAVVEGRATLGADAMHVSLALVHATGDHLWGHQYTFPLRELAAAQERMAADLSTALRRADASGGGDHDAAAANPDAHLLYLRGRYHAYRTNEDDLRRAIDYYQRAIALAPTYAPAYAGLAHAHRTLSIVGQTSSRDAFAEARAAASKAMALDPGLAEAHIALGWIAFFHDWDWETAERELTTAIVLRPGSADAHREYAHILSNLGRHEEALVAAARARELDPRSPLTNALEGQFLFYSGRYDEAEQRLRSTLEIDPEYWVPHLAIGRVQILRGRIGEATRAIRHAVDLSDRATEALTQLGYVLAIGGDPDAAREIMTELRDRATRGYVPAYGFAMIHNGLQQDDEALAALRRSVDQREVQATFIRIDSRWDRLRPDPRFIEILRTIGLGR